MTPALAVLATALLGAGLGCVTGIVPGLHVNTLAVILVALAPGFAAILATLGVDAATAPFLVAGFILAITISHTFVNILPATYLGAPDESTALSVLPAHRLLLEGRGYQAISINAYASFFSLVLSLALVFPARWILLDPINAWDVIRRATPVLLFVLVAFLIVRDPARLGPGNYPQRARRAFTLLAASSVFLASGLYGLVSFRLPYDSFLPLPPSPLLPMLSGLFGAATLLEALARQAKIPHQFLRSRSAPLSPRGGPAALGCGVAAGAAMSLFPGLTNATATAVASAMRRANDAEILVSLGAVNTANALFNLLVLWTLGRSRSGAVVAIEQLVPIDPWTGPVPAPLVWLLFSALAAGAVSLAVTLVLGRVAARRIHLIPYRALVTGVLVYVVAVVIVFSGLMGLAVFVVGAALGLVPVRLGLQRTHLTGVLLVPVLGYLWM